MAEQLSFGIGPLVRGAVLLARRVTLFRAHYRIARSYTTRRAAARIAWSWAGLLKTPARGVLEPGLGWKTPELTEEQWRAEAGKAGVALPDGGQHDAG